MSTNKVLDLATAPNGGVVLCGRRGHNACCPILSKDEEGNIVITDDFGGSVKMSLEQASLIGQALEQMAKN